MPSTSSIPTASRSSPEPGSSVLDATRVGFSYDSGRAALRSVDLRMDAGEIVGMLGPNGSGKTTFLRLAGAGARSMSGQIRWFPDDPGLSEQERRRRIAAVFERIPHRAALSGIDQATALTALRGRGAPEAAEEAAGWLLRFGLAERSVDPVGAYSLGMRRRLGLAEAFASGARVLLLDEPLIGLDPAGRAELAVALEEWAGEGRSALLTSHDARFAAEVCHRVLLLDEGRAVAHGTPAELIADLAGETRIALAAPDVGEAGDPPDGLREVERTRYRLEVATRRGSAVVAQLALWAADRGLRIGSIEVREPGLEEVFFRHTGKRLDGDEGKAP